MTEKRNHLEGPVREVPLMSNLNLAQLSLFKKGQCNLIKHMIKHEQKYQN